jgi:hypothetical protein
MKAFYSSTGLVDVCGDHGTCVVCPAPCGTHITHADEATKVACSTCKRELIKVDVSD